jgi:hypothetical protein
MDFLTLVIGFILGFVVSAFMLAGGMSMKIAQAEREGWHGALAVLREMQTHHDEWHGKNKTTMPDLTGPKRKAN